LDKLAQRMEVNGNRTPRSFAIKTLGLARIRAETRSVHSFEKNASH